jgi:hypothetical protein
MCWGSREVRQTFYLNAYPNANCESKVKKSLIAFLVAFGLSIAFTFLPLIARVTFSVELQTDIAESLAMNTWLGLFFSLLGLSVFFVVFYFLANNNKMLASKSTIIAILLGVTLGPAILYLLNIFLYRFYLALYLNLAASAAVSGVFMFFLPALIALIYAELRERKSSNNLAV